MPPETKQLTPQQMFARSVEHLAERELMRMAGKEAARRAAARISLAVRDLAQRNPKVYDCTPQSIGRCVALTCLTGLSVGGPYPECDIIPRERKVYGSPSVMEAHWQIGFRGALRLTQRAGYRVTPHAAYIDRPVDLDEQGILIPPAEARTAPRTWDTFIGILITVHEMDTGRLVGREWMDRDQVEERRDCSEGYRQALRDLADPRAPDWKREKAQDNPWIKWPEEMAKKTAIRYVVSRGLVPIDDTIAAALEADAESDRPAPLDITPTRTPDAKAAPKGTRALAMALEEEPLVPDAEPEPEPVAVRSREELLAIAGDLGSGKAGPEARKALGISLAVPLADLTPDDLGRLVAHLEEVAGG